MQADFNPPVLATDTSTSFLSFALRANGKTLVRHNEVGNRQSELILPQTGELFAEAGIGATDLGAIVYAQGPGTFTGPRIGISVAQGLAAPFATPLIGVSCLDVAAYRLPGQPCVLAATNARMGEVFYAWFDTAARRRLSGYHVDRAAEITLLTACTERSDGIDNAFALVDKPPFTGSPQMPTAADHLDLAAIGRYPATNAAQAALLYVRDKIALTAREQAERKAAP